MKTEAGREARQGWELLGARAISGVLKWSLGSPVTMSTKSLENSPSLSVLLPSIASQALLE